MVSHKPTRTRKKAGLGCGFTAMVGLTCIALLIFNGLALDAFLGNGMNESQAKLIDPLKFVASVVLIFAEFWIYDRIKAGWNKRQSS